MDAIGAPREVGMIGVLRKRGAIAVLREVGVIVGTTGALRWADAAGVPCQRGVR